MIETLLRKQLEPVARRRRRTRLHIQLATCWLLFALAAAVLAIVVTSFGWPRYLAPTIVIGAAVVTSLTLWGRVRQTEPDYRQLARDIEAHHPDLHALLLTAVEQSPDPRSGSLNFLQRRVIETAVAAAGRGRWSQAVPAWRVLLSGSAQAAALLVFLAALGNLLREKPAVASFIARAPSVSVSPGNTTIERGSSLVVLARFEGMIPSEATLVAHLQDGLQRIPLIKNLDDPTFGGTIPAVAADIIYSVEYPGATTPDYKVRVFDYPKLERADAAIQYPAYTGKQEARIKDTRRATAVEGSRLNWTLHLNKPVRSARFVAKNGPTINLDVATNAPTALLNDYVLERTRSYQLQLVDADGRTNRIPAQFVFEALTNRAPELKLTSPRSDQRLSSIQEIAFQAEAWDDFGVSAYGMTYTVAGSEPRSLQLGTNVPATEKRPFGHLLKLEELGVSVDQLVSWFVWADDIGPDGAVRRTSSDMHFAEIRPFEEIYRQGDNADSQQSAAGGGGGGSESMKLAELQKQIINATWKLVRQQARMTNFTKDVEVVRESQENAIEQAESLRAESQDPRTAGLWEAAEREMKKAAEKLTATDIQLALAPEQSAYQALLKISDREFMVSQRQRQNSSGGRGGGEQGRQQQLDQLEFKGEDNRYETQTQAERPQTAEQREQLGVLNRLKELAQRQQDVNERLKELQTALQQADTEKEREEIRRELKRLREEEQEMLANVDELLQRMSQPQNQSQMADARRELEKTRENLQRTSEALAQDSVPEALTSGTRAERELEQMRDEMRKKNSSQFAEEMREMRSQARDLAQRQQQLGEKMQQGGGNERRKTLSDSDETQALAAEMDKQKGSLTNLLTQMQDVSEKAELVEPLLSKQLYDALRKANQDDAARADQATEELLKEGGLTGALYERLRDIDKESRTKALDVTAELLRQGLSAQARDSSTRARSDLEQLKRGVERAAETAIGDDTEALRAAQSELDQLTRDLEREMAMATTNNIGTTNQLASAPGVPSETETNELSAASGSGTGSNQVALARQGRDEQNQEGRNEDGQGRDGQNQEGQGENGQGRNGESQASAGQGQNGGERQGNNANGRNNGGPFRLGQRALEDLLRGGTADGTTQTGGYGPLTGEDYFRWSERLGNVEEMVESPNLRSEITRIRDRARAIRTDFKQHAKSPQWSSVQLQLIKPLNEVRKRVAEELAKRQNAEALVPIDRDPVPARFSEMVRRYYEQLGRD